MVSDGLSPVALGGAVSVWPRGEDGVTLALVLPLVALGDVAVAVAAGVGEGGREGATTGVSGRYPWKIFLSACLRYRSTPIPVRISMVRRMPMKRPLRKSA